MESEVRAFGISTAPLDKRDKRGVERMSALDLARRMEEALERPELLAYVIALSPEIKSPERKPKGEYIDPEKLMVHVERRDRLARKVSSALRSRWWFGVRTRRKHVTIYLPEGKCGDYANSGKIRVSCNGMRVGSTRYESARERDNLIRVVECTLTSIPNVSSNLCKIRGK